MSIKNEVQRSVPSSRSSDQIHGTLLEPKIIDDELEVPSVLVRLVSVSSPAKRRVFEADVVRILLLLSGDRFGGLGKVPVDELGVVKELVDPLEGDVWADIAVGWQSALNRGLDVEQRRMRTYWIRCSETFGRRRSARSRRWQRRRSAIQKTKRWSGQLRSDTGSEGLGLTAEKTCKSERERGVSY
jgi:hypothetical protein